MASLALWTPLALLLGAALALYVYATRHFAYWRRKGVPFVPPLPFAGNLLDVLLFRTHVGLLLRRVYTRMQGEPFVGMFFFDQPVLLVRDFTLWKTILTKDYEYFQGRGFSPAPSDTLWAETLFARKGQRWKDLRMKLSSAFTTGKMKRFFALLEQKATTFDAYFDDAVRDGSPRDVMNVNARYAMDVVSTVGFGLESRVLLDDDDPLYRVLRKVFVYSKVMTIMSLASFVDLPLLRLLRVSLMPAPLARWLRSNIWGAVREREQQGLRGARGDFLDLLMELRDKGHIADDDAPAPTPGVAPANTTDPIDMNGDIFIAQAFSVLAAGFDTTMTTMSYAMYHMAKDQTVQERLRTQLQRAMQEHDGRLTYEALQSVEYLDWIFLETLRLYPVIPFLDRTCTKEYRIPGTDVVIDKGVFVFTSFLGVQGDPDIFPDPERFDPERFSDENRKSIPSGAFSPFSEGPRKCIGMRLGSLQGKLGLARVILNYRLHVCSATPEKIEFNLHSFFIHPRNGIHLKFTRVNKNLL